MPCSDGSDPYESARLERDRADRAARVACEALRILDRLVANGTHVQLSGEATAWWVVHKADDAERERRERERGERDALRQAALRRLTPAERRALGLGEPS